MAAAAAAAQLRVAAEKGDCGKLRELLAGGGASVVNERTEVTGEFTGEKFETTALFQAVGHDQHAAVELLLGHSANPNLADSRGFTPLMVAAGPRRATGGKLHILRTLLNHEANINAVDPKNYCTAFHCACLKDQADCAVELARRGCDMTLRTKRGETGKDIAERRKHTAVLAGLRALVVEQLRAKQQSNDADNLQLEGGCGLQSNDAADDQQQADSSLPPAMAMAARALRVAAQKGDCGKLRELLDGGGASVVNERTEGTNTKTGKVQTTALVEAVTYGQHAAVDLLLAFGANPNLTDHVFSPLMKAAGLGKLRILQTLLGRETTAINAADSKNYCTAFHWACLKDHADCAVALARRGCDMTLQTKDGQTGEDIAEHLKHTAVLAGLRALAAERLQAKQVISESSAVGPQIVPQRAEDEKQQKKKAKKKAANRKKKARQKKAKKAAELLSQQDLAAAQAELTEPSESSVQVQDELAATVNEGGSPDCQDDSESFTPALLQLGNEVVTRQDYLPPDGQVDSALGIRVPSELHAEVVLPVTELQSQPELQSEPEPELDERTINKVTAGARETDQAIAGNVQGRYENIVDTLAGYAEDTSRKGIEISNERERQAKQAEHALTELGVQLWSAAQVLEWVALTALPPETVSVVTTAMESLDVDGDDLIGLQPKILQKLLAKHGAQDAEALAKQVMQQRDALLLPGDSVSESASPKSELSDILECPLCMELYCDDETGLRVPRILTKCGHTVCHGCITNMLTQVLAEGNAKPYKCPTCSKVTKVSKGKAGSLAKNFALAAALEAL
eukprot:COSAG06_NODE_6195_length_3054_cov_8.894078_1_plen_800_part_00